MTVESIPEKIVVEALDKAFSLDEFELSKIDKILFKWELGGLTDPVGQLINWLWSNIQDAFCGLSNDIWGWLNTIKSEIISRLGAAISGVSNVIESIATGLESAINNIGITIESFVSSIESAISTLQQAISRIGTAISGIASQVISGVKSVIREVVVDIENLTGTLSGLLQNVISQLSSLGSSIYNYISSFGNTIFGYIKELTLWISEGFKGIETVISGITKEISGITKAIYGFGKEITSSLQDLFKFISGLEKEVGSALSSIPEFFNNAFEGLEKFLHLVVTSISATLSQFGKQILSFGNTVFQVFSEIGSEITQLGNRVVEGISTAWSRLSTFLEQQYNNLTNRIKEVGIALSGFINPLVDIRNWTYSKLQTVLDFFNISFQKLETVGSQLWNGLQSVASTVWNAIQKFSGWVMNIATGAINTAMSGLLGLVTGCIESSFSEVSKRLKNIPSGLGEADILSYVAQGYSLEVAKSMAAAVVTEAAGEAIGDQEISLEPVGVGGRIKLKLGSFLKKVAEYIRKTGVETAKFAFGALSFWLIEPAKYYVYSALRNKLPIELPSTGELIEFARRHMPTKQFKQFLNNAIETLQLRGYNDWVINGMFQTAEQAAVTITDRFGKKRTFPISLLYDIPSRSELCRMMMHDIIINVEDFTNAMEMAGVHPDIAFLFYLLHFRYMPLDRLWEFYRRGLAGFLKLNETFLTKSEKEMINKGLGFNPVAPAQFNGTKAKELLPAIAQYAKWHNYAFFGWEDGLPSDRLIALELLSKIPERIDSRWLYRWSIIDDKTVEKIIIARGYHDDWVEPLTIAECMNALAEERNLARTGVINAYERGFLTENYVNNLLSELTKVKILGKDVPVKFLPGEVKLLTIRGKYDRAIKLLDSLSYALIDGYKENIIKWDYVTDAVKKATDELSNGLGISLDFDSNFYKLYFPIADEMKTIYTIKRIRYWLRYLLMEIVRRFEEGYITKQELDNLINNIQKWAALTEEEKKALEEIAETMLLLFNREIEAKAILKRLSRGVITTNEAKQKLVKLGLNESTAEAMIDYYAKTYSLSPSSLVELAEYVPIPETELKKKLEIVGMPQDEMKVYPAYAFARRISSYIRRLVTELIDDYVDGVITLKELEDELNNLATMNGLVKRKFRVEWIVLSPDERKLIIELAKLRKERHEKRRRLRSS